MSFGNAYNKRGKVITSTYNMSSFSAFKKEIYIYICVGNVLKH